MRSRFLLIVLCGSVLAQYDDDDFGSALPQRVIIPGAVPAGRPQVRPRIQGAQGRVLQSPRGSGAVPVLRVHRPGAPGRGEKPQQQGYPSTLSAGEPQILRSTPNPLGPTPSLPAILAQARPLPHASTILPRPIQEEPFEDETETDLDSETQALSIPSSTSLPASLSTRPQSLQPAAFRPTRPAFKPERPLVPHVSPSIEDIQVPSRQQFRQSADDLPVPTRQQFHQPTEDNIATRQQLRQQPRPVPTEPQYTKTSPQEYNTRQQQITRQPPPQQQFSKPQRGKKPVAQVISRYREDNEDGSITWGYENDDGSFKEETIGVDCVVRGKYGYTDPDGLRRQYTYSSGIPCDKEEENRKKESTEGFEDYQNNKYVLPNGDAIDLESAVRNKARKPVTQYRN
ncbi:bromodomain-containing protein 4 [Zootermopsis nevadensis]|uniref:bromodomain-containing protein 4 n=1 Tax=Zootermopsis nevadensis TaxID=136037 RepID=UPI000B8E5801|nr:bromodomain-containing protein 4 [Zootermopsis nevadensis]